ncbi:MAG TPA: hypothetical protein ENI86_13920, partial [Acidimicrobiales bacterium]|nr:hypothetical protein [Acidimicrobiales bacterium]
MSISREPWLGTNPRYQQSHRWPHRHGSELRPPQYFKFTQPHKLVTIAAHMRFLPVLTIRHGATGSRGGTSSMDTDPRASGLARRFTRNLLSRIGFRAATGGPNRHRNNRRRRRLHTTGGLLLLGVILLVAACSGSSGDPADGSASSTDSSTTSQLSGAGAGQDGSTGSGTGSGSGDAAGDPADGGESEAAQPLPGSRTAIIFTSTDGSALGDSRTVFSVTDTTTNESFTVPVVGNLADTRAELEVPPGTYRISTTGPSVSGQASYTVRDFEPVEVTIAAPTADAPEQVATIDFGLDVQVTALELRIEDVTATSISLSWVNNSDISITEYVLRRTDGSVAVTDPSGGQAVPLSSPTADSARVRGLTPETEYTFTLFATADDGRPLRYKSLSVTTASLSGDLPSFALAPNTIVPTDLDSLNPESIDGVRVRVTLAPGNTGRASTSPLPGVDPTAFESGGCVVGAPFLLTTDVAGDDAFYGVIESCDSGASGFRQTGGGTTAVVNSDVPMAAVFTYFDFSSSTEATCIDLESGRRLDAAAPECAGGLDSDGDGVPDSTELAAGTDPSLSDSDADGVSDYDELYVLGTDPLNSDSDFDTLLDTEGFDFGTDPLSVDSDGDGCLDPAELALGRDPANPADGSSPCPAPEGVESWESLLDGLKEGDEALFQPEEPAGPDIADLGDAQQLGSGEVQVTLLWDSGDDLDLYVTDPNGEQIYFDAPNSSSGGFLDVDDRGGDCTEAVTRAENVFWETGAPSGTYTVEVQNFEACGDSAVARLQVRVGGELVVDRGVNVGVDGPITFTVDRTAANGSRPVVTVASDLSSAPSAGPRSRLARGPKVECEAEGEAVILLNPYVGPYNKTDFSLRWWGITWDVELGVKASVNPKVSVSGTYSCALDLPSQTFQLTTYPVPINLELAPVVEGAAQASINLEGPSAELTIGIKSTG